MSILHILDKQTDDILDIVTNYWDDNHRQTLTNEETLDFTMDAMSEASEHVQGMNRIVVEVEEGLYREFVIDETQLIGKDKYVFCTASYLELKRAKPLPPSTMNGQTVNTMLDYIIRETDWERGQTEYLGIRSFVFDEYISPYDALMRFRNEFDAELVFRIEIENNRIVGRYIDVLHEIGSWEGKEIVSGKDLVNVERTERTNEVVTALIGLGPELEEGYDRIIVEVTNEEAYLNWGRNGRHIWGVYTPDIQNPDNYTIPQLMERVRELTEQELNKRISSVVEYKVGTSVIENVFERSHEKVRLGDKTRVKATEYNPPIYLDSRVIAVEGSVRERKLKQYTLGEFIEYREEDINAIRKELEKRLAELNIIELEDIYEITYPKRVIDEKDEQTQRNTQDFVVEYAEKKKFESPVEPMDTDVIWVDTSDPNNVVWKVFIDGRWVEGPSGPEGPQGEDGAPRYIWIKYADDEYGNGISDNPEGKKYIGIAHNKESEIESFIPEDYTWSPLYGNIQVGGRNLILNSRELLLESGSHNFEYEVLYSMEPNTTYTFSTEVTKIEGNAEQFVIYIYDRDDVGCYERHFLDISEGRKSVTFTTPDNGIEYELLLYAGINGQTAGNTVLYEYLQLEEGNTATDWSPAPEDFYAEIERARQEAEEAINTADEKNSIFYQDFAPSIIGRKNGDIWFDTSNDYRMHRFSNGYWFSAEFGNNAIGEIDAGKITSGYINAGRIASGTITGEHIDVTNLSAISADLGQIEAGLIKGVHIEGSTFRAESEYFPTFTEIDETGRFYSEGEFLFGYEYLLGSMEFTNGQFTLRTETINGVYDWSQVQMDRYGQVISNKGGHKLYLSASGIGFGNWWDRTDQSIWSDPYGIKLHGVDEIMSFTNGTRILYDHGNGNISVSGAGEDLYLGYYDTNTIHMGTFTKTPRVFFHGFPITNRAETGYCGIGGAQHQGANTSALGVGVNFRIQKNYTPSSVSFDTLSRTHTVTPKFTNITRHGFWLYITDSEARNGTYVYWRGYYTA